MNATVHSTRAAMGERPVQSAARGMGSMATIAPPVAPTTLPARTLGDPTDNQLVAAVRAGDDRAFERLYERYHRRIAAYIYGMVNDYARAEEVSYDAEEGLGAADYGRLVTTGPTPDAAVDQKMSLDHLCGAFGGLSETHHEILVMRELEGLSYREIGERLGMSRPSVESTLFRARRRLSEEYEDLVSGERCRRIQAIITGASDGRAGTRDERKMARHVSYCQPCRRAAFAAGFDADALTPKRTVREKIAALLPLPAFLKRRIAGHGSDDAAATSAGGHAATLAQLSTAAASYADPAMHWGKAVAKAAAVAAAVVGAGVAAHDTGLIGAAPRDERPAAVSSPATPSRDAAGSLSTRPAANGTSNGTNLGSGGSGGSTPSSNPSSGASSSGSSAGTGSSGGSSSPSTPLGD